jgi:uncharacterized protein involved in copper resistance
MKYSRKIAIGAAAALGLAAGVVIAHPGQMGSGMGMHGQMSGMQHGQMDGMGHGQMGAGPAAAQQLMTPEEQAAFREKMQNARTAEERQKLAEANRAEMEKRAKEKGITLPEPHGPRAGFGPHGGPAAR